MLQLNLHSGRVQDVFDLKVRLKRRRHSFDLSLEYDCAGS